MSNKSLNLKFIGALSAIAIAVTVVAFQNCSGRHGDSGSVSAASCVNHPIFREAYPKGVTFTLPQGNVSSPYTCFNQTGYDTVKFNPSNDTLVLSGFSGSITYKLTNAGTGCGSIENQGADQWRDVASSDGGQTNIQASSILFQLEGMNCEIAR